MPTGFQAVAGLCGICKAVCGTRELSHGRHPSPLCTPAPATHSGCSAQAWSPSTISPLPSCPCHPEGVQVQGPSQPVQRCPRWGSSSSRPHSLLRPWVPVPLLPLAKPLWLLCSSSWGPGHQVQRLCSLPYPLISSWKAPLVVSELNQQEESRGSEELAPGGPSPSGQGPGCPCLLLPVQPCHRLGPSA